MSWRSIVVRKFAADAEIFAYKQARLRLEANDASPRIVPRAMMQFFALMPGPCAGPGGVCRVTYSFQFWTFGFLKENTKLVYYFDWAPSDSDRCGLSRFLVTVMTLVGTWKL